MCLQMNSGKVEYSVHVIETLPISNYAKLTPTRSKASRWAALGCADKVADDDLSESPMALSLAHTSGPLTHQPVRPGTGVV